MSSSQEARLETMTRAIRQAYPDLCEEARVRMASELIRLIDKSIAYDYDLRAATLFTKGAQKTTLGSRLRQLRMAAGLTQDHVTHASEWHAAKISRIERGSVPVTATDLRFLLGLYKVRDPQVLQSVINLAREDRDERRARRHSAA